MCNVIPYFLITTDWHQLLLTGADYSSPVLTTIILFFFEWKLVGVDHDSVGVNYNSIGVDHNSMGVESSLRGFLVLGVISVIKFNIQP